VILQTLYQQSSLYQSIMSLTPSQLSAPCSPGHQKKSL
jgi:hypothetical protein